MTDTRTYYIVPASALMWDVLERREVALTTKIEGRSRPQKTDTAGPGKFTHRARMDATGTLAILKAHRGVDILALIPNARKAIRIGNVTDMRDFLHNNKNWPEPPV